jgi:hypothetical protein
MEGKGESKLHTDQCEQLPPKSLSEHQVSVAHYGVGHAMETHYHVEEGPCDGRGGVGVPDRDEACIHGEAIDDGDDQRLVIDAREHLVEVAHLCCAGTWCKTAQSCTPPCACQGRRSRCLDGVGFSQNPRVLSHARHSRTLVRHRHDRPP